MSPRLFITGITGYVGGDVLHVLSKTHPDWEISALIRSETKAQEVVSAYPNVKVVLGDLDSTEIIVNEVKKADIVYNFADCDHTPSAHAIALGAAEHPPSHPLWIIHTSGAGILTLADKQEGTVGISRSKIWDDWDNLHEVTSLPVEAPHRPVDRIILAIGENNSTTTTTTEKTSHIHTAIICPPVIYGPGRGPCHKRSMQAYWMSELVLLRGKGFSIGPGENTVCAIHVHDLADLYILLGEAAASGGGTATWDAEGYYFAENDVFQWRGMHELVARITFEKGFIESPEVEDVMDVGEIVKVHEKGVYAWGTNQLFRAERARRVVGWRPYRPKLREVFAEIVDLEAGRLGIV